MKEIGVVILIMSLAWCIVRGAAIMGAAAAVSEIQKREAIEAETQEHMRALWESRQHD